MSKTDELKDELTSIMYGAGWKKRDIADAFKPDVEAAMKLIKAYGDTREREGVRRVYFELNAILGKHHDLGSQETLTQVGHLSMKIGSELALSSTTNNTEG